MGGPRSAGRGALSQKCVCACLCVSVCVCVCAPACERSPRRCRPTGGRAFSPPSPPLPAAPPPPPRLAPARCPLAPCGA
eukprot:2000022-Alexandrium_andersonii.AAC.1